MCDNLKIMLGTRTSKRNQWQDYLKALTLDFLSSLTTDNVEEKTTEDNIEELTNYLYNKVNHCGEMIVVLEKAEALAEDEDKEGLAQELCNYKEMKAEAISVLAIVKRLKWGQ